jgi:hypothetical protein
MMMFLVLLSFYLRIFRPGIYIIPPTQNFEIDEPYENETLRILY